MIDCDEVTATVTAVNGTNVTTSDATFTNNQAIVRFTFMYGKDFAAKDASYSVRAALAF